MSHPERRRPPPDIFVLSGGPCAGKTTLLGELARLGHPVVPEVAGELIVADGGSLWASDPLTFQKRVFERQVEREREAEARGSPTGVVILDRGLGDHFGYLRLHGIEPFAELEAVRTSLPARYRAVLFLDPHPDYSTAEHRREDPEEARRTHHALRTCWRELHPRVVDIPWLPVEERLARARVTIEKTRLVQKAGEDVC